MFDANSYRKEVLKPLLDKGEHDVSDPFAVVGLDPSVDDEDLIRQRMGEVVAFWRKEQSSPRYKGLVSSLLAQQDAISAQLLDPGRRAQARERVQGASAASDAAAAARVDELLDALERRHGGIPRDRLDRLRSLARREGITDAQIDDRLAGRTLVDERADTVEPIPASQRKQVASLLAELERLDRSGGGAHRTLYGFLGLPVGAGTDAITARREAIDARNRQRRHDRLRTVVDELLALTGTLLVEGDPQRYLAGIEEGVKEEIRPAIETAVLLEDRVSAAESERLTREAVSAGLAPDVARDLVVEVARELHAPIDVGSIADYVVCATCNATNVAQDGVTTCTRCGSDLYRSCPRCGTTAARSDVRCSSCRFDLRAFDEAAEDLERAAADLDAGRLGAAAERVEQAAAWGDDLPDLIRLRDRVASAQRTADDAWDNLAYALDTRRVDDARRYHASLGRIAADRPGPDGTTLDAAGERVAELEGELASAVATAAATAADEREAALLAVLDRFPGASAVAAALADVGVRPASSVEAARSETGITVRWSASPSPGPVEYRVARTIDRSGGATTPLGVTTDLGLTDAGAPPGEPVTYAVVATRLGITAEEARSDPVVHAPAVADLEAVEHDGAVELRWRAVRTGDVWVERSQPDDEGAMTRKLRGGPAGVLDTAVRSGTRYRYEVVTEYPATATSAAVRSAPATVEAVAFTLPDAPPAPTVDPSGRSITVSVPAPPPAVEAVLLRARSAPTVAAGSVVDDAARRSLGGALAGSGGTGYDAADGGPRWYLAVHAVRGHNVVGPAVAHPGVAEVEAVRVEDGMLRWTWPPTCTEAVVHWSAEPGPVEPGGPGVVEGRTTNTAYEIKGGWPVPDGARSFLVLAAGRIDGERVALPGWSDAARASL